MLLPVAFFWDIENCQVPVSKSTFAVVQRLREQFGDNLAEVEFVVVCDVTKERPDVVEDLNAAQITVIHVKSLAKNACDDKLRTSMTKFGMCYRSPGVVVVISSDVNFAHSVTDLRYRCGFRIILLHNEQISQTLLLAANEQYEWQRDVLAFVPDRPAPILQSTAARPHKIIVSNLPAWIDEHKIRDRLSQLCDNCGGRVLEVDLVAKTAKIAFITHESAMRAQKRMQGTNVFGRNIAVCLQQSNSSNVGRASTPQLHHVSTAPASITFIGRSRMAHHFYSGRTVSEGREAAAEPESVEQLQEGTMNRFEYAPRSVGTMRSGVWMGDADIDNGLDFTPVKMKRNEAVQYERSNQAFPERQLHSPSSTMRLLERFAREAVELLRSSPQCQISISRFNSTWCSHFNRPLRLADFGFANLTDLLAEVGDTLQIVERSHKDKYVTLSPALLKTSLQDQIVSVLRQQPLHRAPIDQLLEFYQSTIGYALNLRLFGFRTIDEVLASMHDLVEIEMSNGVRMVELVEFRHRQMLSNQLLYMFIRCPERRLASWQLENEFRSEFGIDVSISDVKKFLGDFVRITEFDTDTIFVELNPIQRLALRLRRILVLNSGELPMNELEQIYVKQYGERILLPDDCGANKSLLGVLRTASHVLYLKGRGSNNIVCINRNFLSSLKDLKPDLFIPPDVSKAKKRGHGHPRSQSSSGFCERMMKAYCENDADVVVMEERDFDQNIAVQPQIERPISTNDGISATSTPPDMNGFDNVSRVQMASGSAANVVIAGSGALQMQLSGFPFIRGPMTKSTVKVELEMKAVSVSSLPAMISAVPIVHRRSRLAANFDALPKNDACPAKMVEFDTELIMDVASKVTRLKMFPYFDAAHYIMMVLAVREDLATGATLFSRKHPLSCWLSSILMCFAGNFLANFLMGESVLAPLKRHDDLLLATVVWYLIFYSPFDIVYKLVKFFPIKVVLSVMKEVQRAHKVHAGVIHAAKIYPNAYLIMILIGTVKGAGSGVMRTVEQLVRGVWVPTANEILRPSFYTKSCIAASVVFVLEKKTALFSAPHELVYFGVAGFFVYFKLSSLILGIHDPFMPFENLFCALFMGGIWDALSRAITASRERRAAAQAQVDQQANANAKESKKEM